MSAFLVKFLAHLAAPHVLLALFSKRRHWALRFAVAGVLSLISVPLVYLGMLVGFEHESWPSWLLVHSPAYFPLLAFLVRSRRPTESQPATQTATRTRQKTEQHRPKDRGLTEPLRVAVVLFLAFFALGGVSVVRGRVVDAGTGRALSGVDVSARSWHANLLPWSLTHDRLRESVASRTFVAACWLCEGVEVHFSKEGFHSEEIDVDFVPWSLKPRDRLRRCSVELLPVGDLATLAHCRGRLVLAADPEASRVLPLMGDRSGAVPPFWLRELEAELGEKVLYVRIVADVDEQGEPVSVRVADGHRETFVGAALDFTTADGGAILYEPHSLHPEGVEREMWEAPATGYQPVLEFGPGSPEFGDRIYFFVRSGDRYGRGSILLRELVRSSDGKQIRVRVEIELNPDGSRNLETPS